MCEGTEQLPVCQHSRGTSSMEATKVNSTESTEILAKGIEFCPYLLELAAKNDLLGFKQAVECGEKIDEVGSWYCRKLGTKQMGLQQRTPAMVASLYGSVDVLAFILDTYNAVGGDINARSASDGSTALHCAVAGGAACAMEAVSLLVKFGADLCASSSQGAHPADVIMASPKLPRLRLTLQKEDLKGPVNSGNLSLKVPSPSTRSGALVSNYSDENDLSSLGPCFESMNEFDVMVSESRSQERDPLAICFPPLMSSSLETSSLTVAPSDARNTCQDKAEKFRDFLVDPTVPDIKNSIYTTDEFRMFSFKVRPCSRAYSHDWTECPFVHPGENARRRDPRRYHYSCVPCPDFRKGACRHGDSCEYAHGVFESWLHPAQYRTRLCKDGTNCSRRVCFFAHTAEELRPLYVSGSAVTSPSASFLDVLLPSSPLGASQSAVPVGPSFHSNFSNNSLPTSPMSPCVGNSMGGMFQQTNSSVLHVPGCGLQSSRLRASLNAKDLSPEDLSEPSEPDGQFSDDFIASPSQSLCTQALLNAAITCRNGNTLSRLGKYRGMGHSASPANLEDLFSSEMGSSPKSLLQQPSVFAQNSIQLQVQKAGTNSQLFHHFPSESHLQFQQAIAESEIQQQSLFHSCPQSPSFAVNSPGRASDFDQNRTRLCKDGIHCSRRVCPFAHRAEELRPLHVSSGSAATSPRASFLDASLPSSPHSAVPVGPSFFQSNLSKSSLPTSPMSPCAGNSLGGMWQQANLSTLHLPGSGLQSSRLRAALNAKDLPPEDLSQPSGLDGQFSADFTSLQSQDLCSEALFDVGNSSSNGNTPSRLGSYKAMGHSVSSMNPEEMFTPEMGCLPKSIVQESTAFSQNNTQFQAQKAAANSQFFHHSSSDTHLQYKQSIAESPIQQQALFHSCPQSPFAVNSPGRASYAVPDFVQNSFNVTRKPDLAYFGLDSLNSSGRESELRSRNASVASPASMVARAAFLQRDRRSFSSRDLGAGSAFSDWGSPTGVANSSLTDWGSPTGKAEWGVQNDDLCKLRKSASFRSRPSEDLDFSWAHRPMNERPCNADCTADVCSGVPPGNMHRDDMDASAMNSWMEQMHLDQVAA